MPAVFISYSRVDKAFVERLHHALAAREYDVWVDWEDIPPSAEWFGEIRAGVDGADGFVYVISPESVTSQVCARELSHAVEQGKRIVPVLRREPGGAEVPPEASARNWIFLRDADDFEAGVELLVAAVETDLEHVRTHTRLGVVAGRWDAGGRDSSMLLRGAELTAAEAWLVAVGDKQPQPTQVQREFVLAGRQAAVRRQRTVFGAVSVALVIAIVLAVVALIQRSTAIHEKNVAYSRQLDANAQNQAGRDPELSVLLTTRAAQVAPGAPTEQALRQALAESHVRQTITLDQNYAGDAVWSPDGARLLVTNPRIWARIYRPGTSSRPVSLATAPASSGQSGWDARGDRVVIGGSRPTVYDAATGTILARLPGIALHAALSSDGTRLATVDLNDTGHVYDVASGRELAQFHPQYSAAVTCFAFSPDDSVIAQCDVKTFNVAQPPAALDTWDARTGRLLHSVHSSELIGSVAFSPDSRRYVYTTTAASSGKGNRALEASIAAPGTFVYDTHTGAQVISFPEPASAASFSPDGSSLAYTTVGDELGHVYDFINHLSHTLIGQPATIDAINFNRSGTYIVTAGNDGTARIYDASNGKFLELLAGHLKRIRTATFGLNDKEIATTSDDGTTRLWVTPDPRPSVVLPGRNPAATVGFTADGKHVLEAESSGRGRILDARTLQPVAQFHAPAGDGFAGAAASRDGRVLAALAGPVRGNSVYSDSAATYDAQNGRMLARLRPTTAGSATITAAMDLAGDRLVTGGSNGSADQWDPRTGRHLASLPGTGIVGTLGYSADGRTLAIVHLPQIPATIATGATLGSARIELWDARSGRHLRTITGAALTPQIPGTRDFSGEALAFSPDGRRVAVVGIDQYLELYSTRTGHLVGHLNPEAKFADSVAFSPDGKLLAVGTAASAYVWRLPSPSPLPEFHHADESEYGFIAAGSGVYVGFTKDSRELVTAGDFALEAWNPLDGTQLFKAFAVRGSLSADGSQFVGTTIAGVYGYPCDLCGGLPHLLSVARRNTTRGFTPSERATFLTAG